MDSPAFLSVLTVVNYLKQLFKTTFKFKYIFDHMLPLLKVLTQGPLPLLTHLSLSSFSKNKNTMQTKALWNSLFFFFFGHLLLNKRLVLE